MAEVPRNFLVEAGGTEVRTAAGGARRYRKPLRCFRWADVKFLVVESLEEWSRHKGARLGASLAFYSLLSLTPLLLVVVSIAGLAFGEKAAEGQIVAQISGLVGRQGASAIQALLRSTRNPAHGTIATVLGVLTLLFGASGVLLELRDALNTIWEVPAAAPGGLKSVLSFFKERLFSFALVLAIGFLLLVSLVLNAWIAALGTYFETVLPAPEPVLHVANSIFSFLIITGLFAAIYKTLPEVKLEWRDMLLGSAVTALLFTLGKLVIGLYLGKASFASAYGAAASVVILIVWVYYSGQIFFFGAEFTRVFGRRYGTHPAAARPGIVTASGGSGAAADATGKGCARPSKLILP
jgi:membrane protein